MPETYIWEFPLPRTHTGVLLGNGTIGAIVWGEGSTLRITLGRADLWDHRGGMPWTEKMSYRNIRDCLERGDEQGLRDLFERTANQEGEPQRPSVLPVGRVDIDLGKGYELSFASLDIATGILFVLAFKGNRPALVRLTVDMSSPTVMIQLPTALKDAKTECVPAWGSVEDELRSISFQPPTEFASEDLTGWVQDCPADPSLCVGYRRKGRKVCIAVERGETSAEAQRNAAETVACGLQRGYTGLLERNRKWWRRYWKSVPTVDIPNERLDFLYHYGMFKFAGFTNPSGVPATLQGAWVEEYRLPPWSNDYHFNINVQMCYQPAFHGNRLSNLRPLFDMIFSWEPILRHNAKVFVGIDDGVMLPHAVDDRCTCMGGFWTGSIDHACTAWVALMMYRYYRYSMDQEFLRDRAYPFMFGAMRVYEEMLERDGDRLALPVSVSPEYRGAAMNAWGKNASFQLSCIHALCEALQEASKALGKRPRPIWRQIRDKLPLACLIGESGNETIALWDGTPLEESHRHHSHLAGITPFDVFDLEDPKWRGILERSLWHWIYKGPGLWSGWCVPWASMIHSHVGNADAAEFYLEVFDRFFTNQGGGTLHDCIPSGVSLMGVSAIQGPPHRPDLMQMDGGMGAVAAIQEMLLHTRRGVNHLFAGAPAHWKSVAFDNMLTDGAFLVSARREEGKVEWVKVMSQAGGVFRLRNPWSGAVVVKCRGEKTLIDGSVLDMDTQAGGTLTLKEAN